MLGLILKHPIPNILLTQLRCIHGIKEKHFIRDKNIFSTVMTVGMLFLTRRTRPNGLLQNVLIHRQMSQLDVNMNVRNNVILYKFEKNAYFRNVKIFGIGQLFGWSILALYTYKPSFWDIFNTDIKFKEYWFNNMFRLSMFLFSIFAGLFMSFFIYALCARTIKYVILNKGGKTLSIITYHVRKKKSSISLPIGMVRCMADRRTIGGYVPLKIKNKSLHYLIDKQGMFVNPKLFDYATG